MPPASNPEMERAARVTSTPTTPEPMMPPMAPSTVLFGLTSGASLCLPKKRPVK